MGCSRGSLRAVQSRGRGPALARVGVAFALAFSFATPALGAAAPQASTNGRAVARAAQPVIVADAVLQRAVDAARERFLARQAFDRFDVAVLLAGDDGRWRRGAHGGDRLAYPASCVKLAYLAGAVHWCTSQGRAPDCLDADVRPMVVNSDNVATGRVVDALSGAPNARWAAAAAIPLPGSEAAPPTLPSDFAAWLERRRYTESLLDAHGLLAGQRIVHKTWPTNSGESPAGYERLALAVAGRNAMSPDAAARLMLALQEGTLVPEGRDYVRALLRRDRWSAHAAFGSGLPPGTRLDAKTGTAYDTVEEIAWFELPDGRRFVVAGFSNGWNPDEPGPYDVAVLGGFVAELLRALEEPEYVVRGVRALRTSPWSTYAAARPGSEWQPYDSRGAFTGGRAAGSTASGATYEWRIAVPRAGRYELAVWYPAGADHSPAARFEIDGLAVPVYYDQRRWGSRWLPLGEVDAHDGTIVVRLRSDAEGGRLVADTLRVSAVPPPASSSAAARETARRDPARPREP